MASIDIGSLTGSEFKGEEAIQKMVALEEKKRLPLEMDVFELDTQYGAWKELKQKIKDLNSASREIFNPLNSAFRKTQVFSSDPNIIEITPSTNFRPDQFKPDNYLVKVIQMAKSTHFQSDSLDQKITIPQHQLTLKTQDKSIDLNFKGGSIEEFSNFLNDKAGSALNAQILDVGMGNFILDIEGKNKGLNQALHFSGDLALLQNIGLFAPPEKQTIALGFDQKNQFQASLPINQLVKDQKIFLQEKNAILYSITKPLSIGKKSTLFLSVQSTSKQDTSNEPIKKESPEKEISNNPLGNAIWIGDTKIEIPLLTGFIDEEEQESLTSQPSLIPSNLGQKEGLLVNLIYDTVKKTHFIALEDLSDPTQFEVALDEGTLIKIEFQNIGMKEIQIHSALIDLFPQGNLIPKNSISQAQNAIIQYKDSQFYRDSNTVDDLIHGVSLSLKQESSKLINLNVQWGIDDIIKQIRNFIITYNNLMDYINNISKKEEIEDSIGKIENRVKKLQEKKKNLEAFSVSEREEKINTGEYFEGFLSRDETLKMLKRKISDSLIFFKTPKEKNSIQFAKQLGITREGENDGINNLAMLEIGYLNLDDDILKKALNQDIQGVQDFLFFRSQPKSQYDKGLLVDISNILKPIMNDSFRSPEDNRIYAGIIKTKMEFLSSQAKKKKQDITDFDKKLSEFEAKQREEFAKVYNAQARAKALQNQIEQRFGNNKG